MEISIIIPVYNVATYLEACLESVRQQTFADYEVWMIDDGSTDGSSAICDAFAARDNRFHAVHQPNGGVSSARNMGLEKASGRWICFIDSDDTVAPHFLHDLHTAADGHEDTLTAQGFNRIYPDHTETVEYEDELFTKENMGDAFELRHLNRQAYLWNKLFYRAHIEQHHLRFDQKIHYAEDVIFVLTYLSYVDQLHTIRGISYNYAIRQGIGSLSQRIFSFESEYACYEAYFKCMQRIAQRFSIKMEELPYVNNVISEYLVRRSIGSLYQKSTAQPKERRLAILRSLTIEQIAFLKRYYRQCGWFHKVTVWLLDAHQYELCDAFNRLLTYGRIIKHKLSC